MDQSKFDLEKEVPYIHNTEELSLWLRPIYIIENYIVDYDTYNSFMRKLLNIIRGCFCIYECRTYPVKFKFYKKDNETQTMELRHFVINMILWLPFVELYDANILNKDLILDCKSMFDQEKNPWEIQQVKDMREEVPLIEDYINNKLIIVLRDHHIKPTITNQCISQVLYNLRNISIDFSVIMGLNFSALTFMHMYEDHDEIRDIMECTFDETMQPSDIEVKLQELQDREVDIYKSIPANPVGVILRSGTGIKLKQFAEFTISEGLKPSLEGVTIPKPIENSTLLRGLSHPSDLYIDATGARKSLVMNKKVMGNAGHFGKLVLMLARTLSMSTEISDCGTKHLVEYEVKSKKHLKKLNGKYYKEHEDDTDLLMVDSKYDKKLIGKKIYVRSAVTCALGDHVCPKCVGITASTNFDIADGLSAFESEEVTKVVNQSILSTKHLLTTNSEVINFNADFYDFFFLLAGEINPNINENDKVDNIEDYAIYINPEDVTKLEEQDYDSLYNTCISNGRFYIRNIADPEAEDILIQAEGEKEIFLTETALEMQKKGKGLIYFKDLDDDCKLFEMVIMNQELTKPLYELMQLLNKQNTDSINDTIDSMSQHMLDILIESNIDANVIAAELIINRLIRSIKDPYVRPDFYSNELEPYQIYTVAKALEKNKSPLMGLSFQHFKRQFLSDDLYEERNGTSFIDPFFWKEVPTDNLKLYSKLAKEEQDKEQQSLIQ